MIPARKSLVMLDTCYSGSVVFIAYAEDGSETAERMYQILKDVGLNPWMDEDILPGETISHQVRKVIKESAFFLALLSKKALSERSALQRQLKYALKKSEENPENKIFIIPVRLDDCQVENEFLEDIQPLDLFQDPEQELEKLLRVLTSQSESENKQDAS